MAGTLVNLVSEMTDPVLELHHKLREFQHYIYDILTYL